MNSLILRFKGAIAILRERLARWCFGYEQKEPNPIADERYAQHEAGWIVEKQGRVVAELKFYHIDPPSYLFTFASEPSSEMPAVLVEGTSRSPDPAILFRNRGNPALVVADEMFFANYHESEDIVTIRDMRPY